MSVSQLPRSLQGKYIDADLNVRDDMSVMSWTVRILRSGLVSCIKLSSRDYLDHAHFARTLENLLSQNNSHPWGDRLKIMCVKSIVIISTYRMWYMHGIVNRFTGLVDSDCVYSLDRNQLINILRPAMCTIHTTSLNVKIYARDPESDAGSAVILSYFVNTENGVMNMINKIKIILPELDVGAQTATRMYGAKYVPAKEIEIRSPDVREYIECMTEEYIKPQLDPRVLTGSCVEFDTWKRSHDVAGRARA